MVPVIYAPEAERDLEAITTFIAKDNHLAAEQFGFRLIERAELLGIFPRLGHPILGKQDVRVFCWKGRLESTTDSGPPIDR